VIRTAPVGAVAGLHARVAAIVARTAAGLPVRVSVARNGRAPVPADSVLALLTLGATHGTDLTLSADGDGAAHALAEVAALLDAARD
jgi:phosphocarrier protein HPr